MSIENQNTLGAARQIDKSRVIDSTSMIEGACTRDVDEPIHADSWHQLGRGNRIEVPAGKAYYVKSGRNWVLAQFYSEGSLTGPLVFAETSIESPLKAWAKERSNHYHIASIQKGFANLTFSGILTAILFSAPKEDITFNLVVLYVVLFACFTLAGSSRLWSAIKEEGFASFPYTLSLSRWRKKSAHAALVKKCKSNRLKITEPILYNC